MNVQELIDVLSKLPRDSEILIRRDEDNAIRYLTNLRYVFVHPMREQFTQLYFDSDTYPQKAGK